MMKQRMFGSRTVLKIAKYAVVIYMFTRDSKYDCRSETAELKAKRTVRKMMKKLHQRLLKDKQYDKHRLYGSDENFSDWIGNLANNYKTYQDGFGVYLLECNQAVHDIIHKYAQDYDPNDKESKRCDFFNEIFEDLTS